MRLNLNLTTYKNSFFVCRSRNHSLAYSYRGVLTNRMCIYIYWRKRDVFLSRIAISYIYTYKRCLLHCKLTSIWYSNTYYRYISNHVTSRKLSANIKFIIISSFSNSNLRYRLFAFSIIVKRLLVSFIFFHLSIYAQPDFISPWKKNNLYYIRT